MSGSGDLEQWLDKVETFADDAAGIGAVPLGEAIDESLRSVTGGDGRLSRLRGEGAATVDVNIQGRDAEVTGGGSMATWAIIEHGTSPHRVNAQPRSALDTPYGPKAMVQVEGVHAQHAWSEGADDGMVQVARALDTEFGKLG